MLFLGGDNCFAFSCGNSYSRIGSTFTEFQVLSMCRYVFDNIIVCILSGYVLLE